MRTQTIKLLRSYIREEVDRLVRRSAGFCMDSGLAGRGRGSAEISPIHLGDEERTDTQEEYGKEQEKTQFIPRVDKRRRSTRQD